MVDDKLYCFDVLIDNPSKSLPASREDDNGTSRHYNLTMLNVKGFRQDQQDIHDISKE